ncbi:MAG: hypothetical protein KDC98_15750 [Planctomycetes bacterium]|nr:hypothetical protein [Planctomycetota bacterium]
MARSRPWLGRLQLALAALAAIVGLVHGLDVAPDLTDRLRDDAYYEFAWAANVAAGRGPSVSDGVCTSGVQLLWSSCLALVAFGFGAQVLPLVAPWLGLLLHCCAAVLVARSSRDAVLSRCAALCWLGNPLLLRECQNGQETALAMLLLVMLWRARRASETRFAVLGLLASLARSDLLFVVASLSLVRHGRQWWRGLWTPIGVVLVHFACNLALGGGVMPDAAAPMAWLWHSNHAALLPTFAESAAKWWWFSRPVILGGPWALASAMGSGLTVVLLVRPWWPRVLRAVPAVAVGCAAVSGASDLRVAGFAALGLALWPASRRRSVSRPLLALFVGLAAIVVVHWAVRWYPRDYYAAPLVVVATVALLRCGRLPWVVLAFALSQLFDLPRVRPEPLAGQQAMALAGCHLAEVLPAAERVGCFNSGILTFEAAVLRAGQAVHRAVLNLDGVVDARAFAALRAGRLAAWLDDERIRFVIDNPVQFATDPRLPHANGHWFAPDFAPERDLVEVARFVIPAVAGDRPGTDGFRLYWRRGRGSLPPFPEAARDLGRWRDGRSVLWPARAGQQLDLELRDGGFRALATAPCRTTVIVAVPDAKGATGRLFVRGQTQPVLVLPVE